MPKLASTAHPGDAEPQRRKPANDAELKRRSTHVHQARRVLDLSIDYYEQFKQTGDQLATERLTEGQLCRVLDELYPSGIEDAASDRTRRSRNEIKQRIIELFVHGNTQGNAPGTKWAAINVIVEHSDWIRPLHNGSQRFARAIDDVSRKTRALELVVGA